MGYGLIQAGQNTRQQAMQGMNQASQLEARREQAQEQLKAQKHAAQMQTAGSAAALAATVVAMM